MGVWGTVELASTAAVLLVLVPLAGLYARRRWLSSKGGVFDCALRLDESGPGTGWATGLARYSGDELQWFRTFSLSTRPRLVLRRDHTGSIGRRPPTNTEAVMMFSNDQIIRLQSRPPQPERIWEMAMNPGSVTGLMSWLEAAPPGGDGYSGLQISDDA